MKKKSVKETLPLTDIEWTTCWMALRYAVNRQTIAASMLPTQVVRAYYNRMTYLQKHQIVEDLKRQNQMWGDKAFGDPKIDKNTWLKFWKAMQTDSHRNIYLKDGSVHKSFCFNGTWFPLKQYIASPFIDTYIQKQFIKKIQYIQPKFARIVQEK